MATLAQFTKSLKAFEKKVEKEAVALTGRVLLAVQEDVVINTPIDTSRARTNWVPTIGSPATQEVSFVEGSRGSTAGQAYQRAMAAARAVAANIKLGDKVWTSNNVPYIRELNGGSSTQHPGLFAEKAAEVGRNTK